MPGSGAQHHVPAPSPSPPVIMATSAASGITTRQPLPLYQQIPLPPSPPSSTVSAEQLEGNGQTNGQTPPAAHAERAMPPASGMQTPVSSMSAGAQELITRQIAFEQHILQQSMHLRTHAPGANEMMARLAAYEQQNAHLQQQLAQAVDALEQFRTIGSVPAESRMLSQAFSMPKQTAQRAEAMQQDMPNYHTMDNVSSGVSATSSMDEISARAYNCFCSIF